MTFRQPRESLADGAAVLEGGADHVREVVAAIGECATARCREPFRARSRELEGVSALVLTEPAGENPYSAVAACSFIVMREQLHRMTREGAKAGTEAARSWQGPQG